MSSVRAATSLAAIPLWPRLFKLREIALCLDRPTNPAKAGFAFVT